MPGSIDAAAATAKRNLLERVRRGRAAPARALSGDRGPLVALPVAAARRGRGRDAMQTTRWNRRNLLQALSGSAAMLAAAGLAPARAAAEEVPFSAGTERAHTPMPPNAADCHHHIYDHRFPVDPHAQLKPPDAVVADYRLLQKRLGTTRNVVVQPSTYGTDNRCLLDALAQFGANARGIVVVNTGVTDDELKRLHGQGVRGIRFNLVQAGATTVDMVEPLSHRVNELGWVVKIHMLADQIVNIADLLNRLPSPILFDHMARIPGPVGVAHPAFRVVSGLLGKGRTWVDISGAYIDSKVGPPTYADTGAIIAGFAKEAPERMLWGTDWPHPTEKVKPDDALLYDLFANWVPDERTRTRILVNNPEALFGFAKSA
jgi:predicted TIM-barrel fold metal-dependent hydrolase